MTDQPPAGSSIPNASRIHARAVEWLIERGEAEHWGQDDQAKLDAWLAESPAHLLAYWRAEDGWKRTALLAAVRPFEHQPPAAPPRKRVWRMLAGVAAVTLIAGMLGVATRSYFFGAHEHVYTTPIGGRELITFADGTQIELNTDTVVRTLMTTAQRTVWLDKGEAYFRVKHDARAPFVVMAGNRRVTDLGTEFFVRRDTGRLDVGLIEGRVRVGSVDSQLQSQVALLAPGDEAIATADSISIKKSAVGKLANELSWRHGMLVFQHTPLLKAANELNRYNSEKIVIRDPAVAKLTMSGAFPATDVSAFTITAREVFGLHVENHGDEIWISH